MNPAQLHDVWNFFFAREEAVMTLPSRRHPRLFVARQTARQCFADANLFPSYRLRSRGLRVLIRTQAALGWSKIQHSISGEGFQWLQARIPELSRVALLLGTAGPARKVIGRMMDREGRILGYFKFGLSELAQVKVRQESEITGRLSANVAPAVLFSADLGQGYILGLSPVDGCPIPSRFPRISKAHAVKMLAPSHDMAFTAWLTKLETPILHSIDEHPRIRMLQQNPFVNIAPWVSILRHRKWPEVIEHGDCAPWNLLIVSQGHVAAIDWEDAILQGFMHFDLIHYVMQTAMLIYRWSPQKTFVYLKRLLEGHGHPESETDALVRLGALAVFLWGKPSPENRLSYYYHNWQKAVWACLPGHSAS